LLGKHQTAVKLAVVRVAGSKHLPAFSSLEDHLPGIEPQIPFHFILVMATDATLAQYRPNHIVENSSFLHIRDDRQLGCGGRKAEQTTDRTGNPLAQVVGTVGKRAAVMSSGCQKEHQKHQQGEMQATEARK